MCVYVCMYVCARVYVFVCVQVCARVQVCVCVRVSIFHHGLLCLLFPTPGTDSLSPALRAALEAPSTWYPPSQGERECRAGAEPLFCAPQPPQDST